MYGSFDTHIYTPGILKDQIEDKIPGLESIVRIAGTWEDPVFQVEDGEPVTSDMIFADDDFFKLFTYKAVEGDLSSALKEPLTVVLTKTLSDKLFGKGQAVDKIIKLNNSKELTVRAIINEPDANSCLSFSAVTSIATRKIVQGQSEEFKEWGWCNFQTFMLLENGVDPEVTEKSILKVIPEDHQKDFTSLKLNPFKRIYFSKFTLFDKEFLINGDKKEVLILVLVAVLILMIALVNFINISTSQWIEQIKQTGVMKVVGANRSIIVRNILTEAFLMFLAALVIAIELVNALIPFIRSYAGIHFNQKITNSPGFILISLGSILVLSLIFSIIPALRISSSHAVDNLKKTIEPRTSRFSIRGALVTAQFTIAIVLIAFTVLVQKQVNYGCTSLGINQDNIIGIKITQQLYKEKDVLKKLLLERPVIKKVSFTQYYPGKTISQWGVQININSEKKQVTFNTFSADAAFLDIMGLQLTMGRFFKDDLSTDIGKLVVNETFIRENKIDNPLQGKLFGFDGKEREIIGVVKDFHFKPVSKPITPLVIRNEPYASYCLVNLQTTDFNSLKSAVKDIKSVTSELSPSFPVEESFFDQAVENMYQSELRFHRIFSLFAGCAIFICCLGILAMSIFASQHRIKEIGIRKVNGARITEILALLNRELIRWVAIAFIIATPLAWYVMQKWLQGFVYKTRLSWWIFVLAGLIALGIALFTVSWQSWRAATRNPVEALRYE